MAIGNKNVAPYTIKFYTSNTLLQPSVSDCTVALASVLALTDLSSYTAKCFGYYYRENPEGDPIEGLGGTIAEKSVVRPQINPVLSPFLVKTESDDYRAFLTTMRKRYKYFYEVTSENTSRIHSSTTAVYVVQTAREIDDSDGNYKITLTLDYGRAYRV